MAITMFPKMKPSSIVKVFDIRKDEEEQKVVAIALQGLINQSSARVYIIVRDTDYNQLLISGKKFVFPKILKGKNPGLRTMFSCFKAEIKKFIIWDAKKDWTWNIALMRSALENALPVTSEIKNLLVDEFDCNIISESIEDIWKNRIEAYNWAISNLLPNCCKDILFSIGLRKDWTYNPWLSFDYAVASRSFSFWLDERIEEEKELIREICKSGYYKPGTPIMGYGHSEDDLLKTVQPFGIGYVVGDYFSNGSFWSSFPSKFYTQRRGNPIEVKNEKVYVSLIWSDGDNAQFSQGVLFKLWNEKERLSVPAGTTFCSGFSELASPLMDWYYKNKTENDEIMAGPSGYQFIYLDEYPEEFYDSWLKNNRFWLEKSGMHTACVWHSPWYSNIYRKYADTCGLDAIFDGGDDYGNWFYNRDTLLLNQGNHIFKEDGVYENLKNVNSNPKSPVFKTLYLIAASYGIDKNGEAAGYKRLKREIEQLKLEFPEKYEFLLPCDLAASIKNYRIKNENILAISIETNGYGQEMPFMDFNHHSKTNSEYRYIEKDEFFIYRFALNKDLVQPVLTIETGGSYRVEISIDSVHWVNLEETTSDSKKKNLKFELTQFIVNNAQRLVYIKFSNADQSNRYKAFLWSLKLSDNVNLLQ